MPVWVDHDRDWTRRTPFSWVPEFLDRTTGIKILFLWPSLEPYPQYIFFIKNGQISGIVVFLFFHAWSSVSGFNFFGSPVASLYIISLLCIITSYSIRLYTASWFRVITHSNRSSSPGNRLARCASPKSSFRLERRNTPH